MIEVTHTLFLLLILKTRKCQMYPHTSIVACILKPCKVTAITSRELQYSQQKNPLVVKEQYSWSKITIINLLTKQISNMYDRQINEASLEKKRKEINKTFPC